MRITFDSVDCVQQIVVPSVSGQYPTHEGLNRMKRLSKKEISLPNCVGAETFLFSCPQTLTQTGICTMRSPGSQASKRRLELYY